MGLDKNIRQVIGGIGIDQGQATAAQAEEFDFGRVMNTVWRSKWLVALMMALGLLAAYLHLQRVTPLYTAEARVLWEVDEQNYSGLEGVTTAVGRDWMLLASQNEVIESGRLLGRVVDELQLQDDPVFNPMLRPPEGWTRWLSPLTYVGELQKLFTGDAAPAEPVVELSPEEMRLRMVDVVRAALEPAWIDGTYVLTIMATTADPNKSAMLANEVARLYILDQLETKFESTRQATDWLTDRVADLRVELEAAESKVEAFSSDTTLVSEESLAVLSRQLKELRERALGLGAEAAATVATREAVEQAWAENDYTAIAQRLRDPGLSRLAAEIADLSPGENDARRQGLIERFKQGYERSLSRLDVERERALAQQRTVERSVVELDQRIATQSEALVEQRQLLREAEASRLIYEFFLGRLKEISVQEGIQQPDARVLTAARVPYGPSYPSKLTTMVMGGFSGVVLGFLFALMMERMNTSFRSAEDLEARTGQTVIGTMPLAPVSRRKAVMRYLMEKPTSALAESVRNLRTSILLANVDNPPQVIMTTSSMPGEGKTTCCVALAQISRAMGKRVLVVECDIRRRTFRNYFELPGKHGLLSVLSGNMTLEDGVHYDEGTGLFVLPGEESSVNAADIFASQRFAGFIGEMRERFDFIFIDTPPVLAVPDARVIAKHADAVVFAVRWNHTPREIVQEGIRQFQQVNVKLAGLVLSQVNVKKMARYGKGYGHYKEASKYYHN